MQRWKVILVSLEVTGLKQFFPFCHLVRSSTETNHDSVTAYLLQILIGPLDSLCFL